MPRIRRPRISMKRAAKKAGPKPTRTITKGTKSITIRKPKPTGTPSGKAARKSTAPKPTMSPPKAPKPSVPAKRVAKRPATTTIRKGSQSVTMPKKPRKRR